MSVVPWVDTSQALAARLGTPAQLGQALQASRVDTLRLFDACAAALPGLTVPQHPTLNPPAWELGHIGWFQTRWLERHAHWRQGTQADPAQPLRPARPTQADELFDSSAVPHATRWRLPLPPVDALRDELARGLEITLAMLGEAGRCSAQEEALYFFRLCLLHEDMHHEAGLYMARALGVPVDDARWQPRALLAPSAPLVVPAGRWSSTPAGTPGFAFDNELGELEVDVPSFEIDAQALRWAEFLPFVESGGYADPRWWTLEGWQWLQGFLPGWRDMAAGRAFVPATAATSASSASSASSDSSAEPAAPRYLRRLPGEGLAGLSGAGGSSGGEPTDVTGSAWACWRGGRWEPLDLTAAACHLSAHEARAWCAWAGRRLPTEFEWERAAAVHPASFRWGDVWEWTASTHQPFPGFVPHPYQDYAAPWFDGRPVLKGASHLTQPRMRHPRYRNFFTADRNDIAAGFRSCAL